MEASRARKDRNHGFKPALPEAERVAREAAQPRHGLARHRNANQSARGGQLHRDDRASPGIEGRMFGGSRVSHGIYQPNRARHDYRSHTQRRVSGLSVHGKRRRPLGGDRLLSLDGPTGWGSVVVMEIISTGTPSALLGQSAHAFPWPGTSSCFHSSRNGRRYGHFRRLPRFSFYNEHVKHADDQNGPRGSLGQSDPATAS